MQHFSHDYRDKLVAEHRLISATMGQLQSKNIYASNHGAAILAAAMDELRIKKVQLEGMIDVLNEYLDD